jgi:putative transposase
MKLNGSDVEKIVYRVVKYKLTTDFVANQFGISQRRVEQLVKEYRDTGDIPVLKKPGRKPYAQYPANLRDEILRAKAKLRCGASGIGNYLRKVRGIKIDNNRIHALLLEEGMAKEEPNKKVRKTPWIRYERQYSLSAGHMDWYQHHDGRWVCVVLDDTSRKILSGGEYNRRSADASVHLLQEVLNKYGHIRRIREVITDHGSEFYANKRDKDGNAKHRFEEFCKANGVKQILCRYNHPQSNGKLEKWFDTYRRHRDDFESFEEFVHWYNCIRPHMSLDWKNLETPEKAFWRKLQGYILGNFMNWAEPKKEAEA